MYTGNKRKLRKAHCSAWWGTDLVIKGQNCATFALGFTGEACHQDSAHEPRDRSAGVKPSLQLGQLRPFGHTGVCGTRWCGCKGAAGKALFSHLRSQ